MCQKWAGRRKRTEGQFLRALALAAALAAARSAPQRQLGVALCYVRGPRTQGRRGCSTAVFGQAKAYPAAGSSPTDQVRREYARQQVSSILQASCRTPGELVPATSPDTAPGVARGEGVRRGRDRGEREGLRSAGATALAGRCHMRRCPLRRDTQRSTVAAAIPRSACAGLAAPLRGGPTKEFRRGGREARSGAYN